MPHTTERAIERIRAWSRRSNWSPRDWERQASVEAEAAEAVLDGRDDVYLFTVQAMEREVPNWFDVLED